MIRGFENEKLGGGGVESHLSYAVEKLQLSPRKLLQIKISSSSYLNCLNDLPCYKDTIMNINVQPYLIQIRKARRVVFPALSIQL